VLGSLDTLKQQLGITDATRDDALTLALAAASLKLLDRCGYSETDVTGKTQIFRRLKYNREARLELRPVSNVVVEGRPLGAAAEDWTPLVADVIDPDRGTFIVLGAQNWWPPTQEIQPRFMRWRDPEWPVIRVTFDVAGIDGADAAPEDLQEAAIALAGYLYDRIGGGAAEQESAGQVRRQLLTEPVPCWVDPMIVRHLAGSFARWR
jgi:hypothetical protein